MDELLANGVMTVYPVGPAPAAWRLVSEGKGGKIPERLLAKLWKERAARQTGLRTEAGKRVRVVYPGRSGTAAGPDFRDALLEVEGLGLVSGDIELQDNGIGKPTVTAGTLITTV